MTKNVLEGSVDNGTSITQKIVRIQQAHRIPQPLRITSFEQTVKLIERYKGGQAVALMQEGWNTQCLDEFALLVTAQAKTETKVLTVGTNGTSNDLTRTNGLSGNLRLQISQLRKLAAATGSPFLEQAIELLYLQLQSESPAQQTQHNSALQEHSEPVNENRVTIANHVFIVMEDPLSTQIDLCTHTPEELRRRFSLTSYAQNKFQIRALTFDQVIEKLVLHFSSLPFQIVRSLCQYSHLQSELEEIAITTLVRSIAIDYDPNRDGALEKCLREKIERAVLQAMRTSSAAEATDRRPLQIPFGNEKKAAFKPHD
jgi:hypothetical protein